jgi:GNAT superfamily N-acetyltransferase
MVLPRARVHNVRGLGRLRRRRDDGNAGVSRRLDRSTILLPEAQGRGLGTALLRVAQNTFDRLQLWTFQRNLQARRFYEAKGFTLVQETDGAHNEEKEPDALYRWTRAKR